MSPLHTIKYQYFNPLPSCEGRPALRFHAGDFELISIHSPHARGDLGDEAMKAINAISIHSPHARGD